ncbi:MAG TPA: hypothetical protein VI172_13615 [Candidatus Dormibacteraeota bacterium]|jgi:hypothetical protein
MALKPAVTSGMPPREALALLPLPSLDELTEAQVRGTACVWDGAPLLRVAAVNLGPRPKKRLGQEYQWFPQSCPGCVRKAAIQAVREHRGDCEQCTDDTTVCRTRAGLEQLARWGR